MIQHSFCHPETRLLSSVPSAYLYMYMVIYIIIYDDENKKDTYTQNAYQDDVYIQVYI